MLTYLAPIADFFARRLLPQTYGLAASVLAGLEKGEILSAEQL